MSEEVEKYVAEIRRITSDTSARFDRMEALFDDMRLDIADARADVKDMTEEIRQMKSLA